MDQIIPTVEERQIAQAGDATVITSLDELIKNYIGSIEKLNAEIKKTREMLTDGFQNDVVYREHEEKAKEAAKQRNATKLQIMKQPAMMTLSNKLKSMTSELKEKKAALSDYLLEYKRLAQVNQLELFDGRLFEIVETAKIVRTK